MSSIDIIDTTKLYIQFTEESLEKHDKQIRADAIDECKEKMKIAFIDVMRSYEGVIYPTKWIDDVLEQLKEQKNE